MQASLTGTGQPAKLPTCQQHADHTDLAAHSNHVCLLLDSTSCRCCSAPAPALHHAAHAAPPQPASAARTNHCNQARVHPSMRTGPRCHQESTSSHSIRLIGAVAYTTHTQQPLQPSFAYSKHSQGSERPRPQSRVVPAWRWPSRPAG